MFGGFLLLRLARARVHLIHHLFLLASALADHVGLLQDRAFDALVDLESRLP
jgi:hypothetical protein